ncbi:hypothetical protein [Bradyrhizobium sp. STM 3809]|uniref:hypothetical protein n=1 Tax=Bradyrhizobium sp. STM 3809 TaxID=551936 RepID=UPI0003052074|nr:hypothetical protein [Bradyrhizobium sp. STM 3809]
MRDAPQAIDTPAIQGASHQARPRAQHATDPNASHDDKRQQHNPGMPPDRAAPGRAFDVRHLSKIVGF